MGFVDINQMPVITSLDIWNYNPKITKCVPAIRIFFTEQKSILKHNKQLRENINYLRGVG